MRLVLDTNVLVAAGRSGTGASNALLRLCASGRVTPLLSVPLVLEYEAVLTRPEHRDAFDRAGVVVDRFLDYLCSLAEPVELHYRWRPQLLDVADEMVLETAINGRADAIVTFNRSHFGPAHRFGVAVRVPADIMEEIRRGHR